MLVELTIENAEATKASLLKSINDHRERQGQSPLLTFPIESCSSCGKSKDEAGPLIQGRISFVLTCRQCALDRFPFNKLRFAPTESIVWSGTNPTFHRSTDYGILLTDQALYLFTQSWLIFSGWKRLPLDDIVGAEFRDSRVSPALHVKLSKGGAVLRTPPDYADEMEFDREMLSGAANLASLAMRTRAGTDDT